jgi:molecular chaperone GrpE
VEPQPKKVVKVKVTDKRGVASGSAPGGPPADPDALPEDVARDYLDDLKRLQAEFDNFRKRTRADQASAGDRAAGRVIEELLPVLDNFERAIAHGEGGEGVQLVFKDFKAALERLGLEEVPAEGAAFDPNVHEAVESREVDDLEESSIIEVYRRGYLHKGQLLRPAMVVVGRPTEKDGR